jgi:hypothetical protein
MDEERSRVASPRLNSLAEKVQEKKYRDAYVASHTRQVLARQMREFRGELSQTEFGKSIGKPQTIVSRLEDPSYSGWSVRTLLEIAAKRNVAAFIRFVDFPTFLKYSEDMSDAALRPSSYDRQAVEEMIASEDARDAPGGALIAFDRAAREGQQKSGLERAGRDAFEPKPIGADHNLAEAQSATETGASVSDSGDRGQRSSGALESAA